MDEHGIEMMILSLNAPAVQAIHDIAKANDIARRANDFLAEQIVKRPDRFFAGFATLPLQDPEASHARIEPLRRTELGFKGALLNGFSHDREIPNRAVHYDLPQYWDFWECRGEAPEVFPFYLLRATPWSRASSCSYSRHPWLLTAAWASGWKPPRTHYA